jgi:signal transduction histidine kinase
MKIVEYFSFNFVSGFRRLRQNPQLLYTLAVAVVIVGAFLFIADRFIGIAEDAQQRLVNVKVGAIHDVFADFSRGNLKNRGFLQERVVNLADLNPTITEFRVLEFLSNEFVVVASLQEDEQGMVWSKDTFLIRLAITSPGESFTNEEIADRERFFKTIRAISSKDGEIEGVIITRQTLSQADRLIAQNIRTSILILIGIIVLIMVLFFRHARIIDYTALYKRLQEVDKMKDDFISMASHELRTPLTVIRGYAEVLLSSKGHTKDTVKSAKNIDLMASQLDALVEDILDVSRIEQGRLKMNTKAVDIKKMAIDTLASFGMKAKEKKLKLESNIESGGPIKADEGRLRQVFSNLVGNALKYTQKGSVTVHAYEDKGWLKIKVSDTGIGMSAEAQKKLFTKFYRIKSKKTEGITGTGLGLWITKQIVEAMKGTISLESIEGVGTHITVSFPLASQKSKGKA